MVGQLARLGFTDREIAYICGCSERTLRYRCRNALDWGRSRMQLSLRRLQWRAAKRGSVRMLIWLGKIYLGQRN
jgi:DNA-directed RNA polymerase specialized sigma24 family protein